MRRRPEVRHALEAGRDRHLLCLLERKPTGIVGEQRRIVVDVVEQAEHRHAERGREQAGVDAVGERVAGHGRVTLTFEQPRPAVPVDEDVEAEQRGWETVARVLGRLGGEVLTIGDMQRP